MDNFEKFVRTAVTDRSLCEAICEGYRAYGHALTEAYRRKPGTLNPEYYDQDDALVKNSKVDWANIEKDAPVYSYISSLYGASTKPMGAFAKADITSSTDKSSDDKIFSTSILRYYKENESSHLFGHAVDRMNMDAYVYKYGVECAEALTRKVMGRVPNFKDFMDIIIGGKNKTEVPADKKNNVPSSLKAVPTEYGDEGENETVKTEGSSVKYIGKNSKGGLVITTSDGKNPVVIGWSGVANPKSINEIEQAYLAKIEHKRNKLPGLTNEDEEKIIKEQAERVWNYVVAKAKTPSKKSDIRTAVASASGETDGPIEGADRVSADKIKKVFSKRMEVWRKNHPGETISDEERQDMLKQSTEMAKLMYGDGVKTRKMGIWDDSWTPEQKQSATRLRNWLIKEKGNDPDVALRKVKSDATKYGVDGMVAKADETAGKSSTYMANVEKNIRERHPDWSDEQVRKELATYRA